MTISPSSKRYLPWLFAIFAASSVVIAIFAFREPEKRWQMALTLVGASAALVHFLYTRHLEETQMFRELFADFNRRYDVLNGALNEIVMRPAPLELSPADNRKLYDYFNLCAEEFYFYRCGYIPDEVWTSWRHGIQIFLRSPAINDLLESELKTASYYGLRLAEFQATNQSAEPTTPSVRGSS